MKLMKKSILTTIIVLALLLSLLSLSSVSSAKFNGNNTTEQIQGFIDGGSDNELILDGKFNNLSTLKINRSMKISGINNAYIDGSSVLNNRILFNITAQNVVITNLTILGYGTAVQSNTGNLTIENNKITTSNASINITSTNSISNVRIRNNNIETAGLNAYGIYFTASGGANVNNITINNNVIKTVGDHCDGIFMTANQTFNNLVYNNNISTNGGYSEGIYLNSQYFTYGNKIYDNNIKTNGVGTTYGIRVHSNYDNVSSNSIYKNSIDNGIDSSDGILLSSNLGNITNNLIYENNIKTIGDYAYGIRLWASSRNITNNLIYNNTIRTSGTGSYGIMFQSRPDAAAIDNDVYSNDIITNSSGIYVMGNANGLNISHNRILSNGSFIYLQYAGSNNIAYANWFGNNTPSTSKFRNINVTSYYVVKAVAIKNKGSVGDNWTIQYTFYLNGTNNTGNSHLLPYFWANLYDENGFLNDRLAYENGLWKVGIDKVGSKNLTIILDNEIINLGVFAGEKANTTISINNSGKNKINETTTIHGVLKDKTGNVLSGKKVNLFVNGVLVDSGFTDSEGRVSFRYKFSSEGNYVFRLSFDGDEEYNGSISRELNISVEKTKSNTIISITKSGKNKINETITIHGVLKDKTGNVLSGKKVNLFVNGVLVDSGFTDSEGRVSFRYKFSSEGNYVFRLSFDGDEEYNGSISKELKVSVKKSNPNPSPRPEPNNTNNVKYGSANMKSTGIPIVAILLVLLSSLGLLMRKK